MSHQVELASMCWSVCLSSESVTRWGQELCFVVYPQAPQRRRENGPLPALPTACHGQALED